MEFPEGLFYTESHEWVKEEGGQMKIGLTDFAQGQMKDIVYVDLPQAGSEFKKGEPIGSVESVKTVADLFTPLTGKVIETNPGLKDHPQYVNEDPYGKGWIVKMECLEPEELKALLSPADYENAVSKEEE